MVLNLVGQLLGGGKDAINSLFKGILTLDQCNGLLILELLLKLAIQST